MFRLLSIILWFISSLAVAFAIAALSLQPSLIKAIPLLSLTGEERLAVIAILGLFGWSLFALLLKAWHVWGEHRTVAVFEELLRKAQAADAQRVPYRLKDSRAVRRVNHMVECSEPDKSKLHEAVPAVASLDATILSGSYGPLNTYSWMLPVLGFMGTALGMSEAIGGFKEALQVPDGNIDVLVKILGLQVIPGLAGAFLITILALGASLVVYLCTVALKDWDQEALNELDRKSIVMLSRIPLPEGPEGQKIVKLLKGLRDAPEKLDEAAKSIAHAATELVAASTEFKNSASEPYTITSTIHRGRPAPARRPAALPVAQDEKKS